MYLPKAFSHPEHATRLMRAHPFATLVSCGTDGWPMATPLPLHWADEGGEHGTLYGHVALGNPHGALIRANPQVLAIFNGPHAYMSPSVYPDTQRVPTWSYVMVQARARAEMVDDLDAKDALLKRIIGDHEPAYAQQWRDLSEHYAHDMLKRITAFRLHVEQVDTKIKLNQHRPESHVEMAAQLASGGENERALRDWMIALGMVKP